MAGGRGWGAGGARTANEALLPIDRAFELARRAAAGHARLITLDAATSGHSPFLDVLQISFVGQVFVG